MKKFITFLTALMLFITVFAAASQVSAMEGQYPRLIDDGDLLTDGEEADLLEKLDEISKRQDLDVVIVTVDSLYGNPVQAFADDYFDYHNYGFGESHDGILLLISMEDRDWAISTCGHAITVFTDAGQKYIVEQFKPYLSDGDYYSAFTRFAELCDEFIGQSYNGEVYDAGNMPKEKLSVFWIFADLLIGFFVALIAALFKKSNLKSVKGNDNAMSYEKKGSLRLIINQDKFINKVVTKRKIESSSHSSSGGGSTTHTSSSGRTHGGSSGKF